MKKLVDTTKRVVEYQVQDLVMVKLLPHTVRNYDKVYKGILRMYEGSFPIEKRTTKVAYWAKLLTHIEAHPIFHGSLKPFHKDDESPSWGESH